MTWFKNMKIRAKLLLAFIIVIVLALVVAVVGILALTDSGDTYTHLIDYPAERRAHFAEAEFQLMTARRDYVYFGLLGGQVENLNTRLASAENAIEHFIQEIELCRDNLREDPRVDDAFRASRNADMDIMVSGIRNFKDNGIIPMYNLMLDGTASDEEILETVLAGTAIATPISVLISDVLDSNIEIVQDTKDASKATEELMMIVLIVVAGAAAVIAILLALYVSGVISKPLIPLNAFMDKAGHSGDISLTQQDIETVGKYAVLKDETGLTIASANAFVQRVTEVSNAMGEIANGNLTVDIELLSDKDVMGISVKKKIGRASCRERV